MRSIQVLGKRVTGWQVLPVDAPDFESAALRACEPLVELLGPTFVEAFALVKEAEYEVFLQVISSWEREHLLLNV